MSHTDYLGEKHLDRERASTEALRQEWLCFVQGLARRPVWLKQSEQGRKQQEIRHGARREPGQGRHFKQMYPVQHQLYTFVCLQIQKIISHSLYKYISSAPLLFSFSGIPIRLELSHLFSVFQLTFLSFNLLPFNAAFWVDFSILFSNSLIICSNMSSLEFNLFVLILISMIVFFYSQDFQFIFFLYPPVLVSSILLQNLLFLFFMSAIPSFISLMILNVPVSDIFVLISHFHLIWSKYISQLFISFVQFFSMCFGI